MARKTGTAAAPSVWVGWVIVTVAVMVIVGASHVIAGLVALLSDGAFRVGSDRLLAPVGYTTWGWVHVAVGAVVTAAGIGLLVGRRWARLLAVVAVVVSALVNVAFLAATPVMSAVVIGFDVLVIYAVTVHGGDLRGVYAATDPDAARYAR